jgi:hypothetical protein
MHFDVYIVCAIVLIVIVLKYSKKGIGRKLFYILTCICLVSSICFQGHDVSNRYVNLKKIRTDVNTNKCIWSNFMSLQITINNLDNLIDDKCSFALDPYGIQIADYVHIPYPENNNKKGKIGDAEKIFAKQMQKSKYLIVSTEVNSLIGDTFSVDNSLKFVLNRNKKFKTIEIWDAIK